jgi:hypothetical protein
LILFGDEIATWPEVMAGQPSSGPEADVVAATPPRDEPESASAGPEDALSPTTMASPANEEEPITERPEGNGVRPTRRRTGSRHRGGFTATWYTGNDDAGIAAAGNSDDDGLISGGRRNGRTYRPSIGVLVDERAVDDGLGRRPRRPGSGRRKVGWKMPPPTATTVKVDGVAFSTKVCR